MAGFGFVYILFNARMPGALKIGCTNRSPHERARELSSPTGVPDDFKVMAYFELEDFQQWERGAHDLFGQYRVNPYREFFELPKQVLGDLVEYLELESVSHYLDDEVVRYHFHWCDILGVKDRAASEPSVEPSEEAANA